MLLRLFGLLLIGTACGGECIFIQTQKGAIQATGFNLLDEPLQITADLLDPNTMRKLASTKSGHFDDVLYGKYVVRLWARGFRSADIPVRLDQATLHVRTQLSISEECPKFLTISGKITGGATAAGLWVKVIPVHGTGGLEAPVNPAGTFAASGLDPGDYLIAEMDGTKLIHSATVKLLGDTRLSIVR